MQYTLKVAVAAFALLTVPASASAQQWMTEELLFSPTVIERGPAKETEKVVPKSRPQLAPQSTPEQPRQSRRLIQPIVELVTAERIGPFSGWYHFCREPQYMHFCNVQPVVKEVVVLTAEKLKLIDRVNRDVNRRIKFRRDIDHWGTGDQKYLIKNPDGTVKDVERWTLAEDGFGDCEEYALVKQQELIANGFPRSSVLLTILRGKKGLHVILAVLTDQGVLYLDDPTGFKELKRWTGLTQYEFVRRQSEEHPNAWFVLRKPPVSSQ